MGYTQVTYLIGEEVHSVRIDSQTTTPDFLSKDGLEWMTFFTHARQSVLSIPRKNVISVTSHV